MKNKDNKNVQKYKPILKWAGGKTQLLEHLLPKIPKEYNKYIEPFFGGGALFFALKPNNSIIADSNPELINLYRVIAKDVNSLISELKNFSKKADENNKRLNSSFKNFSIESSKALEKTMKKMSKNPIYNKIIANQSMQSQQINALIKKNNSLVSKMKDKAAMIKYP